MFMRDPHPIPPPFRGREEQAATAFLAAKRRACSKFFPPPARGRNKEGVSLLLPRTIQILLRSASEILRSLGGDLGRRAVGILDEARNSFSGHRLDVDLRLLRVRE